METTRTTTTASLNSATPTGAAVTAASRRSSGLASPAVKLTRTERDRLINAASAEMTPQRKAKAVDPLAIWWSQIQRKRREGFSTAQIATMLNAPGIDLNVSQRAVRRIIDQHSVAAKGAARVPTAAQATTAH